MDHVTFVTSTVKNICRTCLTESPTLFMSIQDVIEHDMVKVKLVDILVFLNCLENNDEENWPHGMCESCVSTALEAYCFKLSCFKATFTLSQILNIQSSSSNQQRSGMEVDINVVYQDHEYENPLFGNHPVLDFEPNLPENKELTPLPPVSEITSTEQPMRKQNEKKYSCSICSVSFTKIYGLRSHMEKHSGIQRYLCPKCGKGFNTAGGLRQHSQSHKDIGQFKCGFCKKNYKSRQSLKEHFRVAHSSNHHVFVCSFCDKSFTAKSSLLAHYKTHNPNKPFACPDCPKTYTRACYLKIHRLVHTGESKPKPFSCKYQSCERRFATKYSLIVHNAHAHSSERPFKCDVCTKCFATLPGLKTHKESHSKDISCNVCGKHMTNKRVLQKHLKSHNFPVETVMESTVNDVFMDHVYL